MNMIKDDNVMFTNKMYSKYFQLYRLLNQIISRLPYKTYKYTIGMQILETIEQFWKHYSLKDKNHIITAKVYLNMLEVQIRFLVDEQLISNGLYMLIAEFIADIENILLNE